MSAGPTHDGTDASLSLPHQAVFHDDVNPDHELSLWTKYRHAANPCSANARINACKLPQSPPLAASSPSPTADAVPLLPQLQSCWCLFSTSSTSDDDWLGSGCLGEKDRDGQTVSQYIQRKLPRLRLAPTRSIIYLVPVGDVSAAPSFELLRQCVQAVLGLQVKQGQPVSEPKELSQIDVFGRGTGCVSYDSELMKLLSPLSSQKIWQVRPSA